MFYRIQDFAHRHIGVFSNGELKSKRMVWRRVD